jgi:CRISPR-associated protein Cas1
MNVAFQTLYIQTDGVVLRLDHDTVVATREKEVISQIPLHHVQSIVAIGRVSLTSPLLERCARDGRSVVRLDGRGRFLYRLEGPKSGNVLLRTAQYQVWMDRARSVPIVQAIVAGKIYNARQCLLRTARDTARKASEEALRQAAHDMAKDLRRLRAETDLNALRGIEGINAKRYFSVFAEQLTDQVDSGIVFEGRTRRPPRDAVNCVLSFLYALLSHDVVSAVESVGLDPQIGYLHTLRPGRPSLALDLMEELRPILADRIAITLFNRRQLRETDFELLPGGAVSLGERGRRTVIAAYQKRKQDEVEHPMLHTKVPLGRIPVLQARLLARAIRRDKVTYVPFLYKG